MRPATLTRRRLLRGAFWSAVAGAVGGTTLGVCRYLRATLPSRLVHVPLELLPATADPPRYVAAGRFYVAQLRPGEPLASGRDEPSVDTPGGFLVLSARYWWTPCRVHGVEWVPSFRLLGLVGAFMDRCRHAAFNRAGLPVYGPAIRPLDTLAASFDPAAGLLVDTGNVRPGSVENALRTIRR